MRSTSKAPIKNYPLKIIFPSQKFDFSTPSSSTEKMGNSPTKNFTLEIFEDSQTLIRQHSGILELCKNKLKFSDLECQEYDSPSEFSFLSARVKAPEGVKVTIKIESIPCFKNSFTLSEDLTILWDWNILRAVQDHYFRLVVEFGNQTDNFLFRIHKWREITSFENETIVIFPRLDFYIRGQKCSIVYPMDQKFGFWKSTNEVSFLEVELFCEPSDLPFLIFDATQESIKERTGEDIYWLVKGHKSPRIAEFGQYTCQLVTKEGNFSFVFSIKPREKYGLCKIRYLSKLHRVHRRYYEPDEYMRSLYDKERRKLSPKSITIPRIEPGCLSPYLKREFVFHLQSFESKVPVPVGASTLPNSSCLGCKERPINSLICCPCMHMSSCETCLRKAICPKCQSPIHSIIAANLHSC